MDPSLKDWVWFANLKGIITRKKVELLQVFGSPQEVYAADEIALAQTGILNKDNITAIMAAQARENANQTMEELVEKHIEVVTLEDDRYPYLLKNICDPPVCLYLKGKLLAEEPTVAVVGSRKASGYGLSTAKKISAELSEYNVCVISGMARGIDTAAHQGALSSEGRTIAVLGCGLDIVYPPENKKLMERIIEKGAVISEYPPGIQPAPHHFPIRNRIVSGMSVGVFVVEAGAKSGSLITAQLALEQGRDVYALPGNVISFNSIGTNKLIQDGAKLIASVRDIVEEIYWYRNFEDKPILNLDKYRSKKKSINALDSDEKDVYETLSLESLNIDELHKKLSLEIPLLHRVLVSLEMKGLVKREAGGNYLIES